MTSAGAPCVIRVGVQCDGVSGGDQGGNFPREEGRGSRCDWGQCSV